MTENKRFSYMEQFNGFCDVYDYGKIISCMRLEYVENTVNLLNELHEENHQLKRQIDNLEHTKDFCAECCERLEKENEQLKSEIREVRRAYEQLWMRCDY